MSIDDFIADGRNRKASKLVAFIRGRMVTGKWLTASFFERLPAGQRDLFCEAAGVRRASDATWAEVVTILRALEQREPRPSPPEGVIAVDAGEREALVFMLKQFAHRGAPCNLHVVEGDGVARPVFCFILTVTASDVDVLVVATRLERVIPIETVRAVVDA